jgi:hypothetical protein
MVKRIGHQILPTLLCMLIFVSIVAAQEVSIMFQAKVGNGPALQPGMYRVEVVKNQDSAKVRFFKGGDLVLHAPATLTKESAESHLTRRLFASMVRRIAGLPVPAG